MEVMTVPTVHRSLRAISGVYAPFLKKYLNFFQVSVFLNFSDFEHIITLKLFLNTKGVASLINIRTISQSLLMFYCITKLDKSLYFVSIIQKYI